MKKLAALLLVLLVPLAASAEAWQYAISTEADEALLLSEAAPLLALLPESDAAEGELFVRLLARIIDGFGMEYTIQEDAAEFCFLLSGEKALRLGFYATEDALLITSPTLDGYAFREPIDGGDLSWPEATVTSGVFSGDAYEGGTQCATWTYPLNSLGEDVSLIVREVMDDASRPVGFSFTAMQGEAQLATLSVGEQQDTLTLVAGLGLNAQNYWCRMICMASVEGEITYLDGRMEEWLADKTESFSSASKLYAPVAVSKLRATVTQTENVTAWSGKLCMEDGVETLCTFSGDYAADSGALNTELHLGASPDQAALTIRFAMRAADALPPLGETITICTQAEDAALYDSLKNQLSASVAARMMKLLPMDLILELTQYVSVP